MLYVKPVRPRVHSRLGYMYFCDKQHPLGDKKGIVYYHRHAASEKLGRWLRPEEHVHHVNGNKTDNSFDNLEVVTRSEHNARHQEPVLPRQCPGCGVTFKPRQTKTQYCSRRCSRSANVRLFDVEHLRKRLWEVPSRKIAADLGISDTGLVKVCRRYGLPKPPPGYWQRIQPDGNLAPKRDLTPKWRHGTSLGFGKWKCACSACVAAQQSIEAAMRKAGVKHGTHEAYNRYKCRCDACRIHHANRPS